jgi:hypothetical protein
MVKVALLTGSREQRRRQGMAWVHRQLGGKCVKCKRASDMVKHAGKDPKFRRWKKKFTNFDVHHHAQKGKPLFRLGQLYVPTARNPAYQREVLLEALSLLKGCKLMCQECHLKYHNTHGGKTFFRQE